MSSPVTHNLTDIYRYYVASGGKLSKNEFKNLVSEYNKRMVDALFEGHALDLPHHVGQVTLMKFVNNFAKPRIDFNRTMAYKKELIAAGMQPYDHSTGTGVKYLVYHTDPFGVRFIWKRTRRTWTVMTPYTFKPTKGNSKRIAKHIKANRLFLNKLQESKRPV